MRQRTTKIQAILDELSKHGVINVRRAYGNWKKSELKAWEERLHEFAIRPMQQFDYSKGKNASDMAMVIDAMELLYTDKPQAFGFVSSDADLTPLVMHLKSKGAVVFGFGQKKAPEPFQRACTTFLFVENIGTDSGASLVAIGGSVSAVMAEIVAEEHRCASAHAYSQTQDGYAPRQLASWSRAGCGRRGWLGTVGQGLATILPIKHHSILVTMGMKNSELCLKLHSFLRSNA